MATPMDYSAALKYRKLLWDSEEFKELPDELVAIHNRQWHRMHKHGQAARLTIEMQAIVVLMWEQTTESGKAFVRVKDGKSEDLSASAQEERDNGVNWESVAKGTPVTIETKEGQKVGKFRSMGGDHCIMVDVEGEAVPVRCGRKKASLIAAS